MGVHRLVDRLVRQRPSDPVHTRRKLTRDRHRRVLRLQTPRHMRRELVVGHELRCLRPATLLLGTCLRCRRRVHAAPAVAVDLRVDRAPVPTKPGTDLAVGLVSLDPSANLFAFEQGQRLSWHAGGLHWSGLCVDSRHPARHHALTGGTSGPHLYLRLWPSPLELATVRNSFRFPSVPLLTFECARAPRDRNERWSETTRTTSHQSTSG